MSLRNRLHGVNYSTAPYCGIAAQLEWIFTDADAPSTAQGDPDASRSAALTPLPSDTPPPPQAISPAESGLKNREASGEIMKILGEGSVVRLIEEPAIRKI